MDQQHLANLAHLRRARDLVDREYARPLDVPTMARHALMSPGHFSRAFRAAYGETPYNYLATTKASQYTSARKPRKITPQGSPYLVVYPFVKVRPWYELTTADRQRAMDEHITIGREEFPGIKNHTTYSFEIDDQEFMTAFECEEPADFMHLMLRLRESEASAYTLRDTPIFVGQHMPIREALDRLDGVGTRVEIA